MVESPTHVNRFAALGCLLASGLVASSARADAVEGAPGTEADTVADGPSAELGAGTVDVEKSSYLVLSRFEPEREVSGAHDTLGGHHLQFALRRARGGRVVARVTSAGRALLSVAVGAGRDLVWRIDGIDVLRASRDPRARAELTAALHSSVGRSLVELARDLDALVAATGDTRARELSQLLLQGVLEDTAEGAFGAPPAALAELRAALAEPD
ncbi:MAG: hypothetical protein IT379_21045 [Deltaproteobacteria bacterium]|nr:hypothetical protein [Deltaproteobacteria bacterium]